MKAKYIFALCLLWGAVSCSQNDSYPEADDTQIPGKEQQGEDGTPDAPKRLTLELTIDNYESAASTPATAATRAAGDIRDRYFNSVNSFTSGNQVGLFTQGGNLDLTVEEGISAGFFNVPLTCTGGRSFSADELNANEAEFKHRFVYYPYSEAAHTAKGFPIRNDDGSVIDLLIASKNTSTGGMTFKHAFAVLELERGYGFDSPKKPDADSEQYKAAPQEAQENDEYYMQVALEAPVITMRFYPQVERYWTYTLLSNNGVADYQFVGTPEEIEAAELVPGEDYEEGVDYAIFDQFKKYQNKDPETNTYDAFGILLPTVDNATCGSTYLTDGKKIPDYGGQRDGSHSHIKSISLWDNDGIWRTITDIQMIDHDPKKDEFDGRRIYGNTAYPITVRMEANGARLFPVMVSQWKEDAKYDTSTNGISSVDEFNRFNNSYNEFLTEFGETAPRKNLTEQAINDFINGGGDGHSGFGRATIDKDETGEIIDVHFTFLVTAPLNLASAQVQDACLIHRLHANDTFDGGGYEISGIDITANGKTSVLPGFVGRCDGTLKNVNLETFRLVHDDSAPTGIFCGELGANGSVQGCTARNASVSAPNSPCGAIAGKVEPGGTEETPQIVGNTVISSIMQGKQGSNNLWGEVVDGSGSSTAPTEKNNRIDLQIITTHGN